VRGFLADISRVRGKDPGGLFLDVHIAPPTQKAWRIAGELLSSSPLKQLPKPDYLAAQEKLSACIDEQVVTLQDAPTRGEAAVRREVTGKVLAELKSLEQQAIAAPEPEAERVQLDPRSGIADAHLATGEPPSGGPQPRNDASSPHRTTSMER
jgi:hypothetical protein